MFPNLMRFALLILCTLINVPMWGQVREVKNAPSPEVANLGTFGSIPVGHYTGTPEITVPLYTMKVGKLSLPIQASYHLANVKPHTPPTSLGIGWALSAGGYIARKVKGVPDEKMTSILRDEEERGYYYKHNVVNWIDCSQDKSEWLKRYTHLSDNYWYELAADEFTFNFNGYSGTFFMDEDGKWRVISDDNIKVEVLSNYGIINIYTVLSRLGIGNRDYKTYLNRKFFDRFVLTTPDGTQYGFGGNEATEYSVPFYSQFNGELVATCWRLSYIRTVDNRLINFDYTRGFYMCDIHYAPQMYRYKTNYQGNSSNAQYNTGKDGFSGFLMMSSRLDGIRSGKESITFDYSLDKYYGDLFLGQEDDLKCLYWTGKNNRFTYHNLNDVSEHNFPQKNFYHMLNIDIDQFDTDRDIREKIAGRITQNYLKGMTVRKFGARRMEVEFNYVPQSNLKNREPRKLLSRIAFYSEALSLEKAGEASGKDNVPIPLKTTIIDSNPSTPNNNENKASVDESGINGVKKFEYDYKFDYNIDDSWPKHAPLIYTDSWGYYVHFGPCSKGDGEWDLIPNIREQNFELREAWCDDAKIYTLRSVQYPTGGKTVFDYELNDYSKVYDVKTNRLVESLGTAGGLRVKKLSSYDESGVLQYIKNYTYKTSINGQSSGISKSVPCFHETIYLTEDKKESIDFYSYDDMNPYPLNFNTPDVGYSTVFEDLTDSNGNLLTRTKYQYTNYDVDTNGKTHMDSLADYTAYVYDNYAFAPFTSLAFERGKLTSKEVMDANNKVLDRTTYDYIRSEGEPYSTVSQEMYMDNYKNLYALSYLYKTYANRYLVSVEKKEEMTENGSSGYETQYQYTYYGLPKMVSVIPKSGEPFYTVYNYSFDDGYINSHHGILRICENYRDVFTSMQERNIIVPINIEERRKLGEDKNAKITRCVYSMSSEGVPFVSRMKTLWGSESFFHFSYLGGDDYVVNQCDNYGNPVATTEKGLEVVYIWSFNGQRLIASILGSTYEEIKSVLGRSPESYSDDYSLSISLDFLRTKLPAASVYTYSYDDGLNVIRKTEPNGLSYVYEYDTMDRFVAEYREINGNKELLKSYTYNYITK